MTTRLPGDVVRSPAASSEVVTLNEADVAHLRLGWWSKYGPVELERQLLDYPDRSVWMPHTGEYAIAAPWRHREEIPQISELAAPRNPEPLVAALIERVRDHGASAVVAIELDETRDPAFYRRVHLEPLETVIVYEHLEPRRIASSTGGELELKLAVSTKPGDLETLLRIDHASFPWIWRNSTQEFQIYVTTTGVETHLLLRNGIPLGYIGITSYFGWGHLDRIAVLPEVQGRGIGGAAVRLAVARLLQLGAKRVGLSTQTDNLRSRRMYERLGFSRTPNDDYRLYGRVFTAPEVGAPLNNEYSTPTAGE